MCLWNNRKKTKLSANFNETPYIVTHRDETTVTAPNRNGHVIRRNVSHYKWIPKHNTDTDDEDITEDQIYEDNNNDNNHVYEDNNNDNNRNDDYNNVTVRRSTRSKKEPDRYGQGVPSNVITWNYVKGGVM